MIGIKSGANHFVIGNFSALNETNPIIFIRFSVNRQLAEKWEDFSVKISRKLKILVARIEPKILVLFEAEMFSILKKGKVFQKNRSIWIIGIYVFHQKLKFNRPNLHDLHYLAYQMSMWRYDIFCSPFLSK